MKSNLSSSDDSLDATGNVTSQWLPADEIENRVTVPIIAAAQERHRATPNIVRRDAVTVVKELRNRIERERSAAVRAAVVPAKPRATTHAYPPTQPKVLVTSKVSRATRPPVLISSTVESARSSAIPAPPIVELEPRVASAPMAALPVAPVVEASQPVPDEPSSFCAAMSEVRTRRTKGSRGKIDREAASVESWTFGAGMLAAHRGRTKRGKHHTPAFSPSAATSEPMAFGAGILGARSGRAKRETFDRPVLTSSVASAEPAAFGMGMLHARKSRTKTVVAIIVVLAAIAAVCLGPNHRAPSHSTAAAQKS